MLIPHPLPEEHILSHLTRIRKINGLLSNADTLEALRHKQNRGRCLTYDPAKLIASALKVDKGLYLNHHTLKNLGFSKKYKLNPEYLPIWANTPPSLAAEAIHLPFREHAYFCTICTTECLTKVNFSIWDRTLQVPGINSCIKHGTSLLKSNTPHPFSHLPHELLNRATELDGDYEFTDEVLDRYLRYSSISEAILRSNSAQINETAYYSVLIDIFHELRSEIIHKKLIAFLYEMYPPAWLQRNFPFISKLNPHTTLAKPLYPEEVIIALLFAAEYDQLSDCVLAMKKVFISESEPYSDVELEQSGCKQGKSSIETFTLNGNGLVEESAERNS